MSKDKIEVNMNVYDIPILVEELEKANKEIERLNKENTILRQNSQYLVKQKDELEEVINKAIEYIEIHSNSNAEYLGAWETQELVDILKGVDKE